MVMDGGNAHKAEVCAACGAAVPAEARYCHACGDPTSTAGASVPLFRRAPSGTRCVRCGHTLAESAPVCPSCGRRPRRRPGVAALDAWLAAPMGRALWIHEAHDTWLRDRLLSRPGVRQVAAHPSRARLRGEIVAQLGGSADADPMALVEDLGDAVLLVDRAHRLSDHDRAVLARMVRLGSRVAFRAPTACVDDGHHRAGGRLRPGAPPPGLSDGAREILAALAVLGTSADRALLEELRPVPPRALDEVVAAGVIERRGPRLVYRDADLADAVLALLQPLVRARLSEAALGVYAEREVPLGVRAELAATSTDEATALLLLDMYARQSIEQDELTSAAEALQRGLQRIRSAIFDGATAHVGARFTRTLAELRVRRGESARALQELDEALGWSRLPAGDRLELGLLRRSVAGEPARHIEEPTDPVLRARLRCDRELLAAADEPVEQAIVRVRASYDALCGARQGLSYGALLLTERVVARIGETAPFEAAELLDELLESRLAATRALERIWRLRARLHRARA